MITKSKAEELSRDVRTALEAVASKHGVSVNVAGGIFSNASYKPRVEFKDREGTAAEFGRFASLLGLKPTDFGRRFAAQGDTFEVTGANMRSRRCPVEAKRLRDGKMFRFPAESVRVAPDATEVAR